MTKGRGAGKTPAKVVELINTAVAEKSLRSISKATGLGLAALSRFSQGIGEPTQATLDKLAAYFNVPVDLLRDDARVHKYMDLSKDEYKAKKAEELEDGYKKYGVVVKKFIEKIPAEDFELAYAVLNDMRDKAWFEAAKELVKCRDQQKK